MTSVGSSTHATTKAAPAAPADICLRCRTRMDPLLIQLGYLFHPCCIDDCHPPTGHC
jgi:hypothetical protein